MRWTSTLRLRLRSIFRTSRVEDELSEELRYHFDHLVDDHVAAGMSPEDARYAALREMGATEQRKEECRDARRVGVIDNLRRDVTYALRALAKAPGFTAVAILSLALGIGANTAIFSLWNGVLHSSLPVVSRPGELVILTQPDQSGSWSGTLDGVRPWLTVEEFEQLHHQASSFDGLLASESGLPGWQARIDRGPVEEARGRLVSAGYFDVLGVGSAIGRVFSEADQGTDAAYAVIGYPYWQRRFAGSPDVLGKTITIRDASLTIIGVAPRGFIGETSGQQPDFWFPIAMQPLVMGESWLQDTPPEKRMWLHVFGRLKPGVTLAQADAEANAIFRSGLESFYPVSTPERRKERLNQRLALQSAAGGASIARTDFSASLTALLAAVAVLFLIACANLANLLSARGTARQPEIALRLSLGASRGRIIQQLATESLVLSILGGAAALVVASLMHDALVAMLARSDSRFQMAFALDPLVLAFLAGTTIVASVIFGVLPAIQVTKTDAAASLREQSRGAVGTPRSSRWLVSLQLALSLPLLIGAGLLARTVYNLQRADLGFNRDHLAIVRLDLSASSKDLARRANLLAAVRAELERMPGVSAVSSSDLGLFTGGESKYTIDVEGFTPSRDDARDSSCDVVGPGYFSTLGVPIRLGREFLDSDVAGSPNACVINESFARRYFEGRNPIGMRIATVDELDRFECRIVGVTGNAKTQDLRDAVVPRFFMAAAQSLSSVNRPFFLIRTHRQSPAIVASARKAVERVDAALPIMSGRTFEEQVEPLTAQDRTTAQLAVVFGVVALMLAAIGLYGVLSYGVARRTPEIAVRIALGARSGRVIAMILGEIIGLVALGLVAGAGVSYSVSSLVASKLFGVAPGDPFTLALAVAVLLVVALTAAFIPARRASKLDPMAALRQQ